MWTSEFFDTVPALFFPIAGKLLQGHEETTDKNFVNKA